MRIWQARFFGPAAMAVAAGFLVVSLGTAQQGGPAGGGTGGGTGNPGNPGKGTPTPTPTPTPRIPTQTQTPANTPQIPRPIWVTGRVILYDGGAPPESATIERVCLGNSVRAEGYTDSSGYFSFTLGQNNGVIADASTSNFDPVSQPGGLYQLTADNAGAIGATSSLNQDSAYWDCDLRARLAGYRSATVSLQGRRMLDAPDVGTIVLYPLAAIQGFTASATSGGASKPARKAYERGLKAVKKNKPDQAEEEFRKAVQLYPRYAEAWYALGKTLEGKKHDPEAREAYASALAADSKYVYPYEQLYQIAVREQNWKDLVENTGQLLRLDPYEFPAAYYFNALGHFELKEYAAAAKSARQAVQADWKRENPKNYYLLGAILIQERDWAGAAESFRTYLKAAPDASDKARAEKALAQLDRQIGRARPAAPDSAPQQ